MLRIATLAALAASFVAAPAFAASIHISTEGKSPAEVKAEVVAAATRLCRAESVGSLFEGKLQATCVKATVQSALSQTPPDMKLSAR